MIRRRVASHSGKQQQMAEWFEQETGRHLAQDPEPEKVPQVSADEAIDMLEGLCWHEFQQEDGIMEVIQVLQKHNMLRKANKAWGAKESN